MDGLHWDWQLNGCVITNPADINGDGVVDVADMLLLLGAWGVCDNQTGCIEDLNGDGTIDVADMLEMLGAWT